MRKTYIKCAIPHLANKAHRTADPLLGTDMFEKGIVTKQKDVDVQAAIVGPFVKSALATQKNNRLSDLGKRDEIAGLTQAALTDLEKVDKTDKLVEGVIALENNVAAVTQGKRNLHRPDSNSIADLLQAQEIRGEMRKQSPESVKDLFLTACENYDGTQEAFLSSMEGLPYPLTILSSEVIQQGQEVLQKRLASAEVDALEEGRHRLASYTKISKAAREVIQNPEHWQLEEAA